MRVLLELDIGDLDKIYPGDPHLSWRWLKEMREILKEKDSRGESEWELIPVYKFERHPDFQPHGTSYLFATGDGTIGLMPHNARKGNLLFQFWDSDTVDVVRLDDKLSHEDYRSSRYANDGYGGEISRPMRVNTHPQTGLNFDKGLDLYIDVRTPQLMM
jgi:hypothetical protein